MTRVIDSPDQFEIVGENIHATRVFLRNGKRMITLEDGTEAVPFVGDSGEKRLLTVPGWFKKTQPYEQGQVKHFLIAMRKGIEDDPDEREQAAAYLRYEARRQISAGARYLDINPDEVHYDLDIQKRCMRWTVETIQKEISIPLSIDSSSSEIILEGLKAYDNKAGRPIINSIAPERPETIDMLAEYDARVIVMATNESGMPQNADERVNNAEALISSLQTRGVSLSDIFVDAIVFPISVDSQNGNHYFESVRILRERYGSRLHIGMGLSNISFGMPNRRLINKAFIHLALEAGIDAGLIDPIATAINAVFKLDTESTPVKLAMDMLLGNDDFCSDFIMAHRAGLLDE